MTISIFGLGYVGCVSLGCLSTQNNTLIGVDISELKVNLINNGRPTIIEKDIDNLIRKGFEENKISATTNAKEAVLNSDISIVCAGTPSSETGHLNLNSIYKIAENISEGLIDKNSFHVIVIRSTVLPGTNKKISNIIEKLSGKKSGKDFAIVSNPEFLREGTAVNDYFNPALTVLGSDSKKALKIMKKLYSFIDAPIVETSIEVAEIIKYVNNSYHALKVSFANEVGNICKSMSIDSHEVMRVFGMDNQLNISTYYFKPGFSYGGSCLPKDLKGMITIAHDNYIETPILSSIDRTNEIQKSIAFNLISKYNKKKIGFLGLSFKKGTDDLRYSPSVDLVEKLIGKGYLVSIFDFNVKLSNITGTNKEYIEKKLPHLSSLISDDINSVIQNNELIVITYNDKSFKKLHIEYPDKIFIDLVNISVEDATDNYEGICW